VVRWIRVDPDELVPIRIYRYEHEAEVARIALEAAGIPCAILRNTYSEIMSSGTRVAVRRRDAEAAREALA
jgi:hypothetical protein